MKDFRSDNTHGCSPEVIEALVSAASGTMTAYGADAITERVRLRCSDFFEREVDVFPVLTGTGGDALAIASMTPPWGAVFCHDDAHIHLEEMGAAEFYSGGAKVVAVPGRDGRIDARLLRDVIDSVARGARMAVPAVISLTNATEAGTTYDADAMREFAAIARAAKVRVHVDGARFSNAVASTGATPAELTWRNGVDLLTFGGTKNGLLGAELVVVFDRSLTSEIAIRYQRAGQRLSKMRLLSTQLDAFFAGDLWLRNARHANAMAQRLAAGLAAAGAEIVRSVEANIVFVRWPENVADRLQKRGFLFYDWRIFGEDVYRLVTAFDTAAEDVDHLVAATVEAAAAFS